MLIVIISACDDKLDVVNPNSQTAENYWKNQDQAVAAVNAVYTGFITDGGYMRMYPALTDGRGDDFTGDSPWQDLVQVANFTIFPTSDPVRWIWEAHYQIVYRANQVLTYVPDIEMEEELKQRLLGQAYFLRGLAFFNLANTYKEIPIITVIPEFQDDYYPETDTEEVIWSQIFDDFEKAKSLLPISYNSVVGPDQGQTGRATKGAATGMLGKALLYRKEWKRAIEEFKLLVEGPELNVYSLVPDYRDNFKPFNENNSESLFEIQFADPNTVGGSIYNYGGEPQANWRQVSSVGHTYAMEGVGYSDFLPTHWIFEEFKEEKTVDGDYDPRLFSTISFYEEGVSEIAYGGRWINPETSIYPKKYTHDGIEGYTNENNGTENSGINYRILRYADVLLMYAEALNEDGRTDEAYQYIQEVRDRVELPDLTTVRPDMTAEEMRDQIAHERALELAIESIRIHDIIRWGWLYDSEKLAELKAHDSDFDSWTPGNEYLPIPQIELDVNKNLKPNSAN
ncbi:RagB/SusD family nutrient uptake outer membrane protein [Fulvivirga maritima]|uniref:RagB/SusD family nutrient uptake outer membrane protein n=1 Tax=Fulvivirga maritima TaxID=2904247 RepID=UPI001F4147A2|nr:RagB/SusD family nutrient uptake outer membrane protein [Fulvivirga maritima]UII27128.1 RagB/SusD family nutrient uptake outer membrane protein [Fulvivirga maritima]